GEREPTAVPPDLRAGRHRAGGHALPLAHPRVHRPAAGPADRRGGPARQRRAERGRGREDARRAGGARGCVRRDGGPVADDRGGDGDHGGADRRIGVGPVEPFGGGGRVQRRGLDGHGRDHDRGGGTGRGAAVGGRGVGQGPGAGGGHQRRDRTGPRTDRPDQRARGGQTGGHR